MKEIDLYSEAKPRYYQLIPNKEDGLIILALYQKYQKQEFTEDQIIQIINKVLIDLGGSQREENNRNNTIILRLQEFFLWRDRKRKVYGFKNYGEEFCQKVFKRLSESYHPAKIERLFKHLLDTLKTCLEKNPAEILIWMDDHFNHRSNELALQIEILDQQVSESVDEFRFQIKQPQANILQVIDTISAGLDQIKQHAHELTTGFQITYDIDDILQDMLKNPESFDLLESINHVLQYNQNVRNHLDQVSVRIDKIKPRIREFIFEFNQRELDRKTDKFLHYLLDTASYIRQENQPKRLVFPKDIESVTIRIPESIPRFYILTERDFVRKAPLPSAVRSIDVEQTNSAIAKNKEKLEIKKKIQFWAKKALDQIDHEGKLEFSPFFFSILSDEENNLNIAVKIAQRLVKHCNGWQYKITINQNEYHDPNYLNLSLWNMTIQKKT
ncbi:hypothetical protein [Flavobacterium aestuarii]|uniref:hypothetical protein n=1 Tax=Flavobacterium aestuarii TaxID=3149227 RepID=UPI0032B592E7